MSKVKLIKEIFVNTSVDPETFVSKPLITAPTYIRFGEREVRSIDVLSYSLNSKDLLTLEDDFILRYGHVNRADSLKLSEQFNFRFIEPAIYNPYDITKLSDGFFYIILKPKEAFDRSLILVNEVFKTSSRKVKRSDSDDLILLADTFSYRRLPFRFSPVDKTTLSESFGHSVLEPITPTYRSTMGINESFISYVIPYRLSNSSSTSLNESFGHRVIEAKKSAQHDSVALNELVNLYKIPYILSSVNSIILDETFSHRVIEAKKINRNDSMTLGEGFSFHTVPIEYFPLQYATINESFSYWIE